MDDIRFDEKGLVPVVAQDDCTGEVLMLAYANQEALTLTLQTGEAHYYSRSRQSLWKKGETSGHIQKVKEIRYDCDGDAVLYRVLQKGAACHTGEHSCFYRSLSNEGSGSAAPMTFNAALTTLEKTVLQRRDEHETLEKSYTRYLFAQGIDKILKKVGEENAEVIIAAKNNNFGEIQYETADLLYHLTVMLVERGLCWADVLGELESRKK